MPQAKETVPMPLLAVLSSVIFKIPKMDWMRFYLMVICPGKRLCLLWAVRGSGQEKVTVIWSGVTATATVIQGRQHIKRIITPRVREDVSCIHFSYALIKTSWLKNYIPRMNEY